MIRLVLLLSAGLFLALQFGGREGGKMRFGLIEAENEAALLVAAKSAPESAPEAASQSNTPQTAEVAFTGTQRVVAPIAPPVVQTSAAAAPADVRYVSGRTVNVRSGPSTQDAIVDKVSRGDAVTLVFVEDNGWARIRVEGDGIDGYMSMDFLTETAP